MKPVRDQDVTYLCPAVLHLHLSSTNNNNSSSINTNNLLQLLVEDLLDFTHPLPTLHLQLGKMSVFLILAVAEDVHQHHLIARK